MARAYIMLTGLTMLWLFGVACSALSVVFIRRDTVRWRKLSFALAAMAMLVGTVGLRPPMASWPRLYYTFSLGQTQGSIDSTWFFSVPLVVGAAALAYWDLRRRRPKNRDFKE